MDHDVPRVRNARLPGEPLPIVARYGAGRLLPSPFRRCDRPSIHFGQYPRLHLPLKTSFGNEDATGRRFKIVMPSWSSFHLVGFAYPSEASSTQSPPAGHPWLSPWPSLDTPVAQSRREDSGLGPWHLHSATPSETPQCGDSNSGAHHRGWLKHEQTGKGCCGTISETQTSTFNNLPLSVCQNASKHTCVSRVLQYIESLWSPHA